MANLEEASKRLAELIEKNVSGAIQRIVTEIDTVEALEQANVLNNLPDALVEANLEDVAQRLEELFAEELEAIRTEFRTRLNTDVTYSDVDATLITGLLDSYEQATFATIREVGIDLQAELTRQVITGQTINIDDFYDTLSARTFRNLATEIETATSAMSRAVTARKADQAGLTYYRYFGPKDNVTRPFCEYVLGDVAKLPKRVEVPVQRDSRVYTRDEIDQMSNGQGLDVLTYCGGWNCRHQWRPITEEEAKRLGYPS